jgi:hypothetical protein
MSTRILTAALGGMLVVVLGCENPEPLAPSFTDKPLLAQTPADGNGKKVVVEFDFSFDVNCGEEYITGHFGGWAQFGVFGAPKNRNVEVNIFHVVLTYTNSAGETWVTRDVGPDHVTIDQNGDLILAITGRAITGSGYIGHVVVNLDTGETLLIAGKEGGNLNAAACEALT